MRGGGLGEPGGAPSGSLKLALTFDDGPSQWTEPLLEALAEEDARATFFVLGSHVLERPDVLRRCAAAGNEIGNHTWSHPSLTECDDDTIRDELLRTGEAIASVLGAAPRRFRAPNFGLDGRVAAIAAELGLEHVGCDVNPDDWRPGLEARTIADAVLASARDGAIVDLHDGRPPEPTTARRDCTPTVDAVRLLLPALRGRGYELLTVSELSA
jgi:chitooligosaccharide deacetylase